MKKQSIVPLKVAITDAARKAFTALRDVHKKEHFYSYSLYTSDEANYIDASANTEEGLQAKARKYNAKNKKGLDENMRSLRWHDPDWAYHCAGENYFTDAQAMLDARPSSDDLDDDKWDKEFDLRIATFIDVLKALDTEGFFGRGKQREKVTLLVTMGDQETKLLLKCAQQLNPPKVYKEFSQPFLRTTAGQFKGIGSRKVYETVAVALSRNGKVLATTGDYYALAFSLPNKKEILKHRLDFGMGARSIAASPNGQAVAVGWATLMGTGEGGIRCIDLQSRKVLWNVQIKKGKICDVDYSPEGNVIASATMNGRVHCWNAHDGKIIGEISKQEGWVQCVRYSPDGKILAFCDREATRLWDTQSAREIGKISEGGDRLTFSPDGKYIAIARGYAAKHGGVSVWDVQTRKLVKRLEAVKRSKFEVPREPDDYEDCRASGAAFSPDGKFLAVERSWPGSVVLWDWRNEKEMTWMNPDYELLQGVVFLPDGKTVAVAGRSMDGPPLLLWDISDAKKNTR